MSADSTCIRRTIDLVIKESDPEMNAVKDYFVADLAKIGIDLNVLALDSEAYIEKERNGEFNMLFSRTWGAPYDPHSYLESWEVASHVEYNVLGSMQAPTTRDRLLEKIEEVQGELDENKIQEMYTEILGDIHRQAIFLPLWGTRIPYVVSRRLSGFTPSDQTYSYPLSSVRVVEGPKVVTVNPGAGGALFTKLGPTNPHQYFPNQLFAQSWVYEGLVSYGQDGEISPALATSWTTENHPDGSGGAIYTFTLREGAKFHDGTDFNCAVAKLNFDHVLHETVVQRHSWFGTPQRLKEWYCNDAGQFVLETDRPFYPLLQELTYIRPLVFASAAVFANGTDTNPDASNSCNSGDFGSKWTYLEDTVTCAGLSAPIGTGPFKYKSTETSEDGEIDTKVVFESHSEYWGGAPDIAELHIQHYPDNESVEAALLDGSLDMALGIGPLTPLQVQQLKFYHSDKVDVRHSDVLQNSFLVMNTGTEPTNDINVRKAIIHSIDKANFIKTEFAGLERPAEQLLPLAAPYCDVELSPKWTYDFEKASFLNCPPAPVEIETIKEIETVTIETVTERAELSGGAIGGIAIAAVALLGLIAIIGHLVEKEREGKPIFKPAQPTQEMA